MASSLDEFLARFKCTDAKEALCREGYTDVESLRLLPATDVAELGLNLFLRNALKVALTTLQGPGEVSAPSVPRTASADRHRSTDSDADKENDKNGKRQLTCSKCHIYLHPGHSKTCAKSCDGGLLCLKRNGHPELRAAQRRKVQEEKKELSNKEKEGGREAHERRATTHF